MKNFFKILNGIPVEKIVVTFPQKGSYRVQVIFQSSEFNDLEPNHFMSKFKNDPEFKELSNLKEIHYDLVFQGCKFKKGYLNPRGNRNDGLEVGELEEESHMIHLLVGKELVLKY